ncbi:type II secretion system minor pseudopilin [Acetobacter sicerae]|uniref:general secretion pathway protein GspK n=1 Tax=Acetobacter sicerae TaxID=85325 RepID=UPI00156AF61E|nr:type II secretion system protein GspK [Acetobacter sicerae]NHN90761.1 hypothetical protein [Acetobacter sicerae]
MRITGEAIAGRRCHDRGFALLSVLFVLGFVALLISQVTANGRMETHIAEAALLRARIESAADSGVQLALFHLAASGEKRWSPDGIVRKLADENGIEIKVRIVADGGKINPSNAAHPLLSAMLTECGASESSAAKIADEIVDWRQQDQKGEVLARYRQGNHDFGPSGHAFYSIADFRLVLGMTPSLIECLEPHLSFTQSTQPDYGSHDVFVRTAVKMSLNGALEEQFAALGRKQSYRTEDTQEVIVDSIASFGKGELHRRVFLTVSPQTSARPFEIKREISVPLSD